MVNGHDVAKLYVDTIDLAAPGYMAYRTVHVYPQVDKQIDKAIENIVSGQMSAEEACSRRRKARSPTSGAPASSSGYEGRMARAIGADWQAEQRRAFLLGLPAGADGARGDHDRAGDLSGGHQPDAAQPGQPGERP